MKTVKQRFAALFAFTFIFSSLFAQSDNLPASAGLPGDNFSLEGALEMFKKSASPEDFEKRINDESNNVNNLDLNGDGDIDYIKVIDKKDGDVHAFILQAVISADESQDIAVIELEKTDIQNAVVQIVGDEDIYGEETIVEPQENDEDISFVNVNDYRAHGPGDAYVFLDNSHRVIVNVWLWPSVRFIYSPAYVVWTSPFTWRVRPVWWRPWRPVPYTVFHPRRVVYHRHYTIAHTHRVVHARRIYTPVRVTSVTVRTKNQASVERYRSTKTARVTAGNRSARVTSRSTTVQHGNATVTRKTTTVKRKPRKRN